MMAVNQNPAFNFDWKIIYGQKALGDNREQAGVSLPHQRTQPLFIYHSGLRVIVILPNTDKMKGARFKKNKSMTVSLLRFFVW